MSRITATLLSGTVVDLTNGRHTWSADEPIEVRGTDTGPNPYELLLSSLAACTCITVALYCRHKRLALDSVTASYISRGYMRKTVTTLPRALLRIWSAAYISVVTLAKFNENA